MMLFSFHTSSLSSFSVSESDLVPTGMMPPAMNASASSSILTPAISVRLLFANGFVIPLSVLQAAKFFCDSWFVTWAVHRLIGQPSRSQLKKRILLVLSRRLPHLLIDF